MCPLARARAVLFMSSVTSYYLGCVHTHTDMHTYIHVMVIIKPESRIIPIFRYMLFHTHPPVGTTSAGSADLVQLSFILLCYWGRPVHFSSLKACLFHLVLTLSSDDTRALLVITVSLEAFQKHRYPDANPRCSDSEDRGSELRIRILKTLSR